MPKSTHSQGMRGKLKDLLKLRKSSGLAAAGTEEKELSDVVFSEDLLKEIGKENSAVHRARAMKELVEVVMNKKLEEHAVEAIWHTIDDLLHPSVLAEARQAALKFLTAIATGQFQQLGLLRAQFFRLVVNHHVPEDLNCRVNMLSVLTDNGKDISYCEQIGSFLVDFVEEALAAERTEDFLKLLINIVHYNSSFLDKEVITILVKQTCQFCNKAKSELEIENCLQLLDATVRYGGLPSEGLYPIIITLCRTVNIEKFCQQSWKLMRSLVGTRLGHSTIYLMCRILEDDTNILDVTLLRGAVFFIGMCIWGSKRVTTLRHAPISVLPSFKMCLQCSHVLVAHEISLSLQRLVKKYGSEQEIVTWDIILDILEQLLKLLEHSSGSETLSLERIVHSVLTNIEQLYVDGKFEGSPERFFGILQRWSHKRPESSVKILLDYLHRNVIHPSRDDWLDNLRSMMEKYFRKETRCAVRVKVLSIAGSCYQSYKYWFEEELLELLVSSYLNRLEREEDHHVRIVAAQLLVDLLESCSSNKCKDIADCLEKLISRHISTNDVQKTSGYQSVDNDEHIQDVEVAVAGLIKVFKMKIFCTPASHAIQIYSILANHVEKHYAYGCVANIAGKIRREIFKLLLGFRADRRHRLGVLDGNDLSKIQHTVYITCKAGYEEAISKTNAKGTDMRECTFVQAFSAILACLKDEWDWVVLEFVLHNLGKLLQNKALIIGGNCDMSLMCAALCKMINDRMFLNKIKNGPRISVSEFHNLIFPILGVVATYHSYVDRQRQYDLVKSLELGLNTQCARACVICLTVCILEMQQILLRTLPPILVRLSQISATIPMSVPVLEFLSSLKELPELYQNFVEEQYMSIFAMALPYTDSYKFSPYIVTLAHSVITAWFTRCRLPFRKGFVKLITKGLKSSSPRFSELSKSQRADTATKDVKEFHEEMTDVCLDMMARYTFSQCSAQPNRTPVIDFLLSKGPSQSWLVGNSLVTITTSLGSEQGCPICQQRQHALKSFVGATGNVTASYLSDNDKRRSADVGNMDFSYAAVDKPLSVSTNLEEIKQPSHLSEISPMSSLSPLQKDIDCSASSSLGSHGKKNRSFNEKHKLLASAMSGAEGDSPLMRPVFDRIRPSASNQSIKSIASNRSVPSDRLSEGEEDNEDLVTPLVEELTKKLVAEPARQTVFSPSEELLFSRQASKSEYFDRLSVVTDDESDMDDSISVSCGKDLDMQASHESGIFVPHSFLPIHVDVLNQTLTMENVGSGKPLAMENVGPGSPVSRLLLPTKLTTIESSNGCQGESKASPRQVVCVSADNMPGIHSILVDPRTIPTKSPLKKDETVVAEPAQFLRAKRNISDELSGHTATLSGKDEVGAESADSCCNCYCDGWAEILIRRPTGNISWIMKLENEEKKDAPLLNDLSLLVASLNYGDHGNVTHFASGQRERAVSAMTDDFCRDRLSSRTSSDSSRTILRKPSDGSSGRRRHSTGSLDLPCSFKYDSPSPDGLFLVKGEAASGTGKLETPCVGISPADVKIAPSLTQQDVRNVDDVFTVKSAASQPPEGKSSSPVPISQAPTEEDYAGHLTHSPIARSQSGPSYIKDSPEEFDETNLVCMHEHYKSSPVVSGFRPSLSAPHSPEKGPKERVSGASDRLLTFAQPLSSLSQSNLPLRPRLKTMSDLPSQRSTAASVLESADMRREQTCKGYVNPYFVFLHFFCSPQGGHGGEKPIILEHSEVMDCKIKVLDRLPSFDTHKFGVLYVDKNQEESASQILGNEYGSSRYMEFLAGLGSLIKLTECSATEVFTGGLDRVGAGDGKFAYFWKDDTTQVIFHTATLMPNKASDPACNSKKLHIGNDYVTIVYDDSAGGYKFGTITGQFNFAEVVVRPLDYASNTVTVRVKDEFKDMTINTGPHVISDKNLPVLVRQLAIHTNMATVIQFFRSRPNGPCVSNWLERLRQIKRIKIKALSESHGSGAALTLPKAASALSSSPTYDFVDFT